MISASILVYKELAESKDEIEFGVAKALNTFIKEKLMTNFQSQEGGQKTSVFDHLSAEKNKDIKEKFDDMFFAKAKAHQKALADSPGDKTFTIREVINMLKVRQKEKITKAKIVIIDRIIISLMEIRKLERD